jgi:hypothetical protein
MGRRTINRRRLVDYAIVTVAEKLGKQQYPSLSEALYYTTILTVLPKPVTTIEKVLNFYTRITAEVLTRIGKFEDQEIIAFTIYTLTLIRWKSKGICCITYQEGIIS